MPLLRYFIFYGRILFALQAAVEGVVVSSMLVG